VCCIQICTKLSEPIGTDSRIRYIKFGVNIKEYEYCYKFEIKYCDKIVLTDPFNYIVVEVHDLLHPDSDVLRRARNCHRGRITKANKNLKISPRKLPHARIARSHMLSIWKI
jgi:hypothetical protein